jgi:hypothetical protein
MITTFWLILHGLTLWLARSHGSVASPPDPRDPGFPSGVGTHPCLLPEALFGMEGFNPQEGLIQGGIKWIPLLPEPPGGFNTRRD